MKSFFPSKSLILLLSLMGTIWGYVEHNILVATGAGIFLGAAAASVYGAYRRKQRERHPRTPGMNAGYGL